MARPRKNSMAMAFRTDLFSASEWEAIETIETASRLMDKTPAELIDAAYDGPEDIEPDLDGE